jgi:sulfate permease, SulP family
MRDNSDNKHTMTAKHDRGSRLPFLQGVLPVSLALLPGELLAGLTLAALAIPEVMGYTKIAGMPVITGIYTLLIPLALFALFASSRHLVVGADSATAAMLAAGLAGLASPGSAGYVALAGLLAMIAAVLLIAARLIRLGFLADFLSRTVLVGFLTGVGIQVALGQVPGMLGIATGVHPPAQQLLQLWRQVGQVNPHVMCLSLAVLIVIVGARRISRRIPGALIAVSAAILASRALDLAAQGIPVLGTLPGGLPVPALPAIDWSWTLFQQLLPTAFAIFVVIVAQSAATARAYAARYHEPFDEDLDLLGLGIANLGAALSGTFVVNGSPTKTQMVDDAGGRSQLAALVTVVIVFVVLRFFTAPLAYLPEAVLSAVVFLIGVELIDLGGMRRIRAERPWEFRVALGTTVVVVCWGVEPGILFASVLSLLVHTRHGYHPKNVLVTSEQGHWRTVPVSSRAQLEPGLLVYRFTHSMYYANAQLLSEQVLALVNSAQPPLTWFCIDASAVDDVDFTAADTLRSLCSQLQDQGIRVVFALVADDVRAELDRSGLTRLVGDGALFESVNEMVNAYRSRS